MEMEMKTKMKRRMDVTMHMARRWKLTHADEDGDGDEVWTQMPMPLAGTTRSNTTHAFLDKVSTVGFTHVYDILT